MGSPVTWRSVTAPQQNGAAQLSGQGLQTLLAGISGLGDTLQGPQKEAEAKKKEQFAQALQLAGLSQGQQRIDANADQFKQNMNFNTNRAEVNDSQVENAAKARILAAFTSNSNKVKATKLANFNKEQAQDVQNTFTAAQQDARQEFSAEESGKNRAFSAEEGGKNRAAANARNKANIKSRAAKAGGLSYAQKRKVDLDLFRSKEEIKANYKKNYDPSATADKLISTNAGMSDKQANNTRALAKHLQGRTDLTNMEKDSIIHSTYTADLIDEERLARLDPFLPVIDTPKEFDEYIAQHQRGNTPEDQTERTTAQKKTDAINKQIAAAKLKAANLAAISKGVFIK